MLSDSPQIAIRDSELFASLRPYDLFNSRALLKQPGCDEALSRLTWEELGPMQPLQRLHAVYNFLYEWTISGEYSV